MSMTMKTKLAIVAAAVGFTFAAHAAEPGMSKDQYKAEKDRIGAEYKQAKQACDSMSGNEKDVCQKQAKGEEKVAEAELEAKYKNTDKARRDALMAKADADYDVAKEKCDALKGNEKDVCVKDAKAKHETALADVKSRMAATTATGATGSRGEAREARDDAREAQYKAAKERCDSMSGAAKDRCVNDAKARFNQ